MRRFAPKPPALFRLRMKRIILNSRKRIKKWFFSFFHRDAMFGGFMTVAAIPLKSFDVRQQIHCLIVLL